MSTEGNQNGLSYADEAVTAWNEIMSNSRRDMMEDINRANRGELFILHFLSMRNTAALPSELSTALQASTARISALLGALEKKGQIARDIDRSNRRNILVTITEDGRNRVEMEMQEMKNRMTRIFLDMGKSDTAEFIRLTRRFSELMQNHMPRE
jgi:DNA-binding MarR family transcriptional regulator